MSKKSFIVCINDGADGNIYKERRYFADGRLLEYDSNYEDTMEYRSIEGLIDLDKWHYLINHIDIGWTVESETTGQYGHVVEVIRNIWNIPVCLKVFRSPDGCYIESVHKSIREYIETTAIDYISIDRVSDYSPILSGYYVDPETKVLCEDETYREGSEDD